MHNTQDINWGCVCGSNAVDPQGSEEHAERHKDPELCHISASVNPQYVRTKNKAAERP